MPTDMQQTSGLSPEQVRLIKLHKRWADRYTMLWLGFALLLLTGFQFVLDHFGIAAAERTDTLILLAVLDTGRHLAGGWVGNCEGAHGRKGH